MCGLDGAGLDIPSGLTNYSGIVVREMSCDAERHLTLSLTKAGMSMSEIAERTTQIIAEYLDVDPAEVTGESSFAEDFDLDSLAKMELVIAFEEAFSIEVGDDALDSILTVQDAISVIEAARSELPTLTT